MFNSNSIQALLNLITSCVRAKNNELATPGKGIFTNLFFFVFFSSLSSGFNSMAATTLTDIIKPLYKHIKEEEMQENVSTLTAKILGMYPENNKIR